MGTKEKYLLHFRITKTKTIDERRKNKLFVIRGKKFVQRTENS